MSRTLVILFQIILVTVSTVIGDAFLKRANNHEMRFLNLDFVIGLVVYAVTAFLWVELYRVAKFSISGVVYGLVSTLMFVVIGRLVFGEKLSVVEYVGIAMGVGSMVVLARFL